MNLVESIKLIGKTQSWYRISEHIPDHIFFKWQLEN